MPGGEGLPTGETCKSLARGICVNYLTDKPFVRESEVITGLEGNALFLDKTKVCFMEEKLVRRSSYTMRPFTSAVVGMQLSRMASRDYVGNNKARKGHFS